MAIPLNQSSKIINKPWGKECWLNLNDRYCFKQICINAGHKTSLQYHEYKLETIFVMSGEAILEFDGEIVNIKVGDFWTARPGQVHRVTATTDIILLEASTPEVDDVIRLEDDSNRPNGRIDAEHI